MSSVFVVTQARLCCPQTLHLQALAIDLRWLLLVHRTIRPSGRFKPDGCIVLFPFSGRFALSRVFLETAIRVLEER